MTQTIQEKNKAFVLKAFVPAKAGTMPAHDGLGPDDRDDLEDRRKPTIELIKNRRSLFIKWTRPRAFRCNTIT
jgi:hypothetical protein